MTTDCSGSEADRDIEVQLLLDQMEASLSSRREIAMLRIRCLGRCIATGENQGMEIVDNSQQLPIRLGDGLAASFVPMLSHAVSEFLEVAKLSLMRLSGELRKGNDHSDGYSDFQFAFSQVHRLLRIYHQWVCLDPVLAEELARQGSHRALIQLIQFTFLMEHVTESGIVAMVQDDIQEIQDLAGAIAGASRPSFPILSIQPFPLADLQQRLPLKFDFSCRAVAQSPQDLNDRTIVSIQNDVVTILIHQITARQSAQVDVGFVLWPSAVVLSTLLVNKHFSSIECERERSLSILELGSGCGLSGLVAARFCQRLGPKPPSVVLTDFNARVLENLRRNIGLNDLSNICSVAKLDFYQQSGISVNHWKTMDGALRDPVDVILAADVICQASDAVAVANTIHDVLKLDGSAYVVCADAKHRFGVDRLLGECQRVGLTVSTQTVICSPDIHDELCTTLKLHVDDQVNLEQTTGYICGMSLTLFTINKSVLLV